jgi:hypothetical protein
MCAIRRSDSSAGLISAATRSRPTLPCRSASSRIGWPSSGDVRRRWAAVRGRNRGPPAACRGTPRRCVARSGGFAHDRLAVGGIRCMGDASSTGRWRRLADRVSPSACSGSTRRSLRYVLQTPQHATVSRGPPCPDRRPGDRPYGPAAGRGARTSASRHHPAQAHGARHQLRAPSLVQGQADLPPPGRRVGGVDRRTRQGGTRIRHAAGRPRRVRAPTQRSDAVSRRGRGSDLFAHLGDRC